MLAVNVSRTGNIRRDERRIGDKATARMRDKRRHRGREMREASCERRKKRGNSETVALYPRNERERDGEI